MCLLVRVALLLALSVHSVMQVLGMGAESTKIYSLLLDIGVHKVRGSWGGGGGGRCIDIMHKRGLHTIDPCIQQCRDGARRVFTHQADIACTKRAP